MPFVTNITALEMDGATETLRARRPECNGQVAAEYAVATGRGALFTVMPGALAPKDAPVKETRLALVAAGGGARRVFVEETQPRTAGVNLRAASLLVGIGRGMGPAGNMDAAFRLAALLGGEVCCSRAVADAGWLDKDRQVGLSGETVSPAVYLAFGVHGAFQHLAGLAGSPCIIAVNTNKDAPIFNVAEIGVVADAASFAGHLADALERGGNRF
jgi:electron transfer flavoprotein alpha subunit